MVVDVCRPVTATGSPGSCGDMAGAPPRAPAAAVERVVVSRGKAPALFAAGRKAAWGGLWPGDEAALARVGRPAEDPLAALERWCARAGGKWGKGGTGSEA